MSAGAISPGQLKRLQTLWGKLWPMMREIDAYKGLDSRSARLAWVAVQVCRSVESCKALTRAEAMRVLEQMQRLLPATEVTRRPPGRDQARAYGTAGRKRAAGNEVRLPDASTFALLEKLTTALGWDRTRLDLFLASPKSPLRGRVIRTLADANRVIWALKGMLRRAASRTDSEMTPG